MRKRKIGAVHRGNAASPSTTRVEMSLHRDHGFAYPLQGQVLRRSDRREVAIFLRDRALWVADFIDGQGQLVDAATWFRFNCGDLTNREARRRMVRESALPPSAELAARIAALLRDGEESPRDYSAPGVTKAPSPADSAPAQHHTVVVQPSRRSRDTGPTAGGIVNASKEDS